MFADIRHDLDRPLNSLAGYFEHPKPRPQRRAEFEPDSGVRNELLTALPTSVLASLRPFLEPVELKRRQVLHERNVPITHAYFIERGAASILARSGAKGALEVGTLGRKDLAGVPVVLGVARSRHRCLVQVSGSGLRISTENLHGALDELPCLRRLLLAYVHAIITEGTQLVVCNTRHCLKERLARWLLVAQDRLDADEIPLTHESLSRAIGVRRAGVTVAVGEMEDESIVRRGRGRLTILDRAALERTSCECYKMIQSEHCRLRCT